MGEGGGRAAGGLGPEPAGSTVGVEEEFHLVDPETFALTPSPGLAAAAVRRELGERVHAEITTTQLETATGVCRSMAELRAGLAVTRAEARAAAAESGVALLAASTHPSATWREQVITPFPRYEDMVGRWKGLALQQDICGCHVHVGVPDLETAVAVLDRARPYLPVLLAMTGSSPFHEGVDTGYESYRTLWWSRWPNTGPPEPLGSADAFQELVAGLVASGVVADASHLYWDLRPTSHLPTVEFRLADVCTDVEDAVLHATVCASLVRVLADRAERDVAPASARPELLRAARWRAARDGIGGLLFDPVSGNLVEAREAVERLLRELADDLAERGEEDEVRDLVDRLFARGTSAARQRVVWRETGDLRAVAAAVVREGSGA
ncbi:carboxylate-amine ligase [Blastococcus sp. TF02-8]|uniref:carboxylate-amine ligase n=1 Tax=Blastococcus sp. TF02-8 TaxID=2250574 RepID=UPI000DEA5076|nr:glutamate--cysteine ligase [Blastococcus sp. TF02-8]RBY98009.1 carboxylate-amine ligase [Blastococcus sp. TF02-8]